MIQATGANIRTSRPSWKSGRMPTPPRTSPGRLASISCKSTFHSFLHQYMREIGGAHLIPHPREMKRGSWFGNYRELFRRLLDIEWEKSGADIQFLEQVILTRNDFSHNLELGSLTAYQTDEHSKKYPESAFADPRWKRLFARKPLIVPKDRVDQAIEVVHRLCEYLEELRHDTHLRLLVLSRSLMLPGVFARAHLCAPL